MPDRNWLDPEDDPEYLPVEFDGSAFQEPKKQPTPLAAAIDRRTTVVGQRPVNPAPKWYQRLGAAAAGGAAGYVNAAGRARVDAGPAIEGILAPGHKRRLADWQGQVETADAAVQGEQQKAAAEERAQMIAAEGELRKRQMVTAEAQLARANRAEQPPAPKPPPPTFQDRFNEAKAAGASDEESRVYASGGHLAVTPPAKPEKPAAPTFQDRYNEAKAAGATDEEAKIYGSGGHLSAKPPPAPAAVVRTGTAAVSGKPGDDRLVKTIMKNPTLWNNLTPTTKERIGPLLEEAGFTGFEKMAKPATSYQSQAGGYYMRLADAEKAFSALEGHISKMGSLGQAYYDTAPYAMQSSNNKVLQNAQRQFTEARLRKESGAVIPPNEYENDKKMYFPRFGDGPSQLAQKKQARETLMRTFKVQAGPRVMADMTGEEAAAEQANAVSPQPAGSAGPTGSPAGVSRPRRAVNKQTGEVAELVNGKWQKVQ